MINTTNVSNVRKMLPMKHLLTEYNTNITM